MTSDEGKEGFRCQVSRVRAKGRGAESEAHRAESIGLRVAGRFLWVVEMWRMARNKFAYRQSSFNLKKKRGKNSAAELY